MLLFWAPALVLLASVAWAEWRTRTNRLGWLVSNLLWIASYPFIAAPLTIIGGNSLSSHIHGLWAAAAIPTLISASLLVAYSRSIIPLAGCLLALMAAGLFDTQQKAYAVIMWNAIVAASVILWGELARISKRSDSQCPRCG